MTETTIQHEDFAARCQRVLAMARQLYQNNPDWVTFFRQILGVQGQARGLFRAQAEFVAFEKTPEFAEIQQLVSNLRNRKIQGGGVNEPTRVITVRLPESLHEALKAEANDHNTSMNKLCISKLLQVLTQWTKSPASPQTANRPPVNASIPISQIPSTTNFRSTFGSSTNTTGETLGQRYGS